NSPYTIAVFFDEIGHDPCGRVVVTVSVNEAQIARIIRVYCMVFAGPGSRGPAHLHELIPGVVADGKHLAPMLRAVATIFNLETMIYKVVNASGLARL
ncbi:hypothetical protein ACQUWZ_27810, partial [Ralstonia pseudosolanacearum]|uniref:hypothetical protein n=1 Tax=Ralstonia pseudosolanacearum TaxID=1310165 RepID=UPI003D1770C1